ncbi:hypothetical protein RBG61_05915 [Paludicola sp. MB14-C6]|uniref:cyclic-phosphate processing receiver domain-containing protein n=1 Tax=Paludihabitans sp. MB14-C6 TaxID=3070656 RepID=UPI0027DC8DE4|nr:cyclic-phosphate processing receiver domain-containing protein [Paludicola sp. MB14-C6]WMJ24201.1 hypothetical protein RBG61_05915 [Paludicola sp. MB14-C6]
MKLFLDDRRDAPDKSFCVVRNYEDCINLLKLISFEFVSLDFDLGDYYNGLHVLEWMVENNKIPDRLNIHSSHSMGILKMCRYIDAFFPQGYHYTTNMLP